MREIHWAIFWIIILTVLLAVCGRAEETRSETVPPAIARSAATVALCEERAAEVATDSRGVAEVRPDYGFPNQVLSSEEILVGAMYVKCNLRDGDSSIFTVTSKPYVCSSSLSPDGSLAVDVLRWVAGTAYPERLYLTDVSVVPYNTGWNRVNVLLHLLEE